MGSTGKVRGIMLAILLMCAGGILAACGSSASSQSATATSSTTATSNVKQIKPFWTFTGPQDDGGYNLEMEKTMRAASSLLGVGAPGTLYNVPYTSHASDELKLAIAQGYNVIVDTAGLGSLMDSVCKANPKVFCLPTADPAPMAANERAYWPADWNLEYVAGVAAGLMTKSNVIGMVSPYKIPLAQMSVNTFLLGCQSVNPKCKERVVYANSYFDPPLETSAANTLVDAGADVLRNDADSPATCNVAQKRGVYFVGELYDFSKDCPKVQITATVWNMTNYIEGQFRKIQHGTFRSSGKNPDFVQMGSSAGDPHLAPWGAFVPASVKAKVEKVAAEAEAGKNLIKGPIYDTKGKLRFAAGVHPSPLFMMSGWKWYVRGVVIG